MEIFIALIIFAISVYLFIITNHKIRSIRENVIVDDLKKEMEALITEFNAAANRNIELMEDKISEMQELLKKSNQKMMQMEEKMERVNRPVVVEKIVEKTPPKSEHQSPKEIAPRENRSTETNVEPNLQSPPEKRNKTEKSPEEAPEEQISPTETKQKRSDKLKELIESGKSKQELIALGYMENEINLLYFLVGRK